MKKNTVYDATGQRIAKTVTNKNETTGDKFVTTYYVRDPQGNVLAVYEHKHGDSDNGTFTLAEQHLYGASRLGMRKRDLALNTTNANESTTPVTHYELTNHLGNVMAVISDEASTAAEPTIVSLTDYYPFGMSMPERSYDAGYRYGFQGQDRERELWGGEASFFKYRISDNRLGRFFRVDPMFSKFPWNSSYAFSENRVMDAVELEGLEAALIFYGGTRETEKDGTPRKQGISDNNSFGYAANKCAKYYISNKVSLGIKGTVSPQKIKSGKDIVEAINAVDVKKNGLIVRLDILTHSTPFSINTQAVENTNNGIYTSLSKRDLVERYYSRGFGLIPYTMPGFHGLGPMIFMNDYQFTKDAVSIDDIDYEKFADDAIVELHGCNAGKATPLDNIAEDISEKLADAGKKNAVVIAHRVKSYPENGSYQHGKRVVYHDGEVLLETTDKGDLTNQIREKLKEKNKE